MGARCQAVVFKTDYDVQIRSALRKGMSEGDFAVNILKEVLDEITETLDEERNGKPKADDEDEKKKKLEDDGPVTFTTAARVLVSIAANCAQETQFNDPDDKLPKWLNFANEAIFLAFGLGAWRSCVRLGWQFSWICACLAVVSVSPDERTSYHLG